MSSSQMFGSVGLLVGVVKDEGDSELISHVIIPPVVVEFKRCDTMCVVRSDLLGVMTVLNNAGVLFLFLLVDLVQFMEESWVDAFVDPGVGATNSFFVELDNMM
eukprot:10563137-Ditylum_brightwellii.AAC.1